MIENDFNIGKEAQLKEIKYHIPSEKQRHHVRLEYEHSFRKDFLQYIAKYERDNLIESGLWDTIIDRTLAKGKTPPGWGVHHKIPIHGGGKNAFDNMIFIRFSEHFPIHRYIDKEIDGMEDGDERTIVIPYPEGFVLVPVDKQNNFSQKKRIENPEERKIRIDKNRIEKKKEYQERIKN